jgi:hypothetical protein
MTQGGPPRQVPAAGGVAGGAGSGVAGQSHVFDWAA